MAQKGTQIPGVNFEGGGAPASVLGFGIIVGTPIQVTAGEADYSSLTDAITNSISGGRITILEQITLTENIVLTKEVHIFGSGRSSVIDGTFQFSVGSENSSIKFVKYTDNITIDDQVVGIILTKSWLSFIIYPPH